jgi:signal transduction histidine kinase/DNA-binding response OmpR family regulator
MSKLSFILLCFLLLFFLAFTAYRFRVRQFKKRRRELQILVDERTDQLQKANIELETILDDLRKTNEYVLQEREVAYAATKAKSEFLANMSHEIRTPMNAILGFTEILEGEITDQQHKKYLSAISSSGKTLLDLINDILDLSRIEAGKLDLQYEAVNPREIINEITHLFYDKAKDKTVDFQVEVDTNLPEALILDNLRVRQVLMNLVSNALKFTDMGFVKLSIHVIKNTSLDSDSNQLEKNSSLKLGSGLDLVLTVQDTGIGIPSDQLSEVFDAFQQQEGQRTEKYGGSGLGLSITRRLVHMMGGKISVQSEEGEGSTFQVVLKNVKVSYIPEDESIDIKADIRDVRFHKATILVADDRELNRQLLITYLTNSLFDFIEAENGIEAVAKVRQYRPDLVLMDLKMPGMDGSEACRILKEDEELKDIPVIILTASVLKEQRLQIVRDARSDGFLNKPLAKTDLVIELMYHLPYYSVETNGTEDIEETAINGIKINGIDSIDNRLTALSQEARIKLPQLLEILSGDEIMSRWETLTKTMIMDQIEAFLQELEALDHEYHTGVLLLWARRLADYLETFNLKKISETLATFPLLIDQLKAFLEREQ